MDLPQLFSIRRRFCLKTDVSSITYDTIFDESVPKLVATRDMFLRIIVYMNNTLRFQGKKKKLMMRFVVMEDSILSGCER